MMGVEAGEQCEGAGRRGTRAFEDLTFGKSGMERRGGDLGAHSLPTLGQLKIGLHCHDNSTTQNSDTEDC